MFRYFQIFKIPLCTHFENSMILSREIFENIKNTKRRFQVNFLPFSYDINDPKFPHVKNLKNKSIQ